jgi:hypothetical protein
LVKNSGAGTDLLVKNLAGTDGVNSSVEKLWTRANSVESSVKKLRQETTLSIGRVIFL